MKDSGRIRRRNAWAGWLLLAATVLGGVLLVSSPSVSTLIGRQAAAGVNGGGGGTDNCVQPSSGNGNCSGVFGVSVGNITGLVPAKTVNLPVTWANPNNFDILVDSYVVSVTGTNKTGCVATSLTTPGSVSLTGTSRISVTGNKTAVTQVPVTLNNATVTNQCKSAVYAIKVTATAVKK